MRNEPARCWPRCGDGKPPPTGSMIGRQTSAPEGGATTLTTLAFAPEV